MPQFFSLFERCFKEKDGCIEEMPHVYVESIKKLPKMIIMWCVVVHYISFNATTFPYGAMNVAFCLSSAKYN